MSLETSSSVAVVPFKTSCESFLRQPEAGASDKQISS